MSKQTLQLTVSLAPHEHSGGSTARIMWLVVIALVPATIAAAVVFGPRALLVIGVGILTCLVTEFAIETLFRQPRSAYAAKPKPSILDGSAAITGLLLAMNLPAGIPLWQVAAGGIFAIAIAKMVFGGLGQNPFNPALAGRAFMMASFPVSMTSFPQPFAWQQAADAMSGATALGSIKEGLRQGLSLDQISANLPSWPELFLGGRGGCLGEVSILALLAGALLLLCTRVISWEIPGFFLGGLGLVTGIAWLVLPSAFANPVFHLMSGGVVLGAFFMATDYVTSPMTFAGRILYAAGGGMLCALIRLFGSYPEGCSYAILVMNAIVPLIDRMMPPRRFGSRSGPQTREARS